MARTRTLTATLRRKLRQGRWSRPRFADADPYWAHRYFTDGVRLLRFVGWVAHSVDAVLAEFEDCRTLEILLVRVDDATLRNLSPLLPAR